MIYQFPNIYDDWMLLVDGTDIPIRSCLFPNLTFSSYLSFKTFTTYCLYSNITSRLSDSTGFAYRLSAKIKGVRKMEKHEQAFPARVILDGFGVEFEGALKVLDGEVAVPSDIIWALLLYKIVFKGSIRDGSTVLEMRSIRYKRGFSIWR